MFSLTRTTAKRGPRDFIRSFTEALNAEIHHDQFAPPVTKAGPSNGRHRIPRRAEDLHPLSATKVPVREDHGLYAFFRRRDPNGTGEGNCEVVETPDQGQLATGRAWEAAELRNKSFKDLHTLWYVALRERNLLATQKEETRRMGVANAALQVPMDKVRNCRKTMARIKAVLNERRLAYEGAVQLAQEQADLANRALVRKQQSQKREQRKPERYNAFDSQVLLIQQPKSMPKPSRAQSKKARASEPETPANPWNSARAFGNYRARQIDMPDQVKKQPGRRRGVPKTKPVKN